MIKTNKVSHYDTALISESNTLTVHENDLGGAS